MTMLRLYISVNMTYARCSLTAMLGGRDCVDVGAMYVYTCDCSSPAACNIFILSLSSSFFASC